MSQPGTLERIRPPSSEQPALPPKLTDEAINRLVENIEQFNKFKQRALSPKDYTMMGDNQYIEKSGWAKLRLATNTTFELTGELKKHASRDSEGEYYVWTIRGRAIAENGASVEMDGACSSRDEFFSMADGQRRPSSEIDEKDIIATAETNCFNRCMSFLYGFGELSGEEMRGHQFEKKAIRFPFPDDVKGKAPDECDLATLKKYLPTFEKAANDPKNKWADQNKKLVAAIQEAIAEKTAKPESPAGEQKTIVEGDKGSSPAPTGDPSPIEQERIKVNELLESKGLANAWLVAKIQRFRQKDGPPIKFEDLSMAQLGEMWRLINVEERR